MSSKKAAIEKICKELIKDFADVLTWKWDNRFKALLSEFTTETQDKVLFILEKHFKMTWDNTSIEEAPGIIKTNSKYFGNLRQGQLLFTTSPESSNHIIAAWWPWGDGQSISLRIAIPD